MSRIPVHTLDDAPEGTRPTLETLSRRTGKRLDIHAEVAHFPVVLATYAGIADAITAHGTAALEAGRSEQQVSEAFAHLAVNLFTNYVDHYARTELDALAAPVLEAAVDAA